MKTLLACLALGTALVVSVLPARAEQPNLVNRNSISKEHADPEGTGLVQIASTSVLAPLQVVWNRDGTGLYIVSVNAVSLFDLRMDELQQLTPTVEGEFVLAVSPKGVLAILKDYEAVVLRNAHTGHQSILGTTVRVNSAAFSPDGRRLVLVEENGSVLRIWDVDSANLITEFRSPSLTEGAYSVSFSPSGESLFWFSPSGGHTVDLDSRDVGPFVSFTDSVNDLEMCAGNRLIVATADEMLSVWDTAAALLLVSESPWQALSLSCSTDGKAALVTTETHVQVMEASSLRVQLRLPREAVDASYSPVGDALAVVETQGDITIWRPG